MSEEPAPGSGPPDAPHGHWRAATATLRGGELAKRSLGSPLLFTVTYSSVASALYFTLGVVAGHADCKKIRHLSSITNVDPG